MGQVLLGNSNNTSTDKVRIHAMDHHSPKHSGGLDIQYEHAECGDES
jgi:hypothetical protein